MSFSSWNCWDAKLQASDFLNTSSIPASIGYFYNLPDAVTNVEAAADPEPCGRGHSPSTFCTWKAQQRLDRALALTSCFLICWGPFLSTLYFFFLFFMFCLYFLGFFCLFALGFLPPFFVICNNVLAQLTYELHFLINICNNFLKKGIFSWLGSW